MDEYIDRKKALNVCEMHYQHCLAMHDWSGDTTADNIKTDIEYLPAADVVEVSKHRCTKRLNCGYSFYVKCTCGAEFNVDSFYWSQFELCPKCGAKIDGEVD